MIKGIANESPALANIHISFANDENVQFQSNLAQISHTMRPVNKKNQKTSIESSRSELTIHAYSHTFLGGLVGSSPCNYTMPKVTSDISEVYKDFNLESK